MNPVLILTRNCLELTKRCVESVRQQDIPVSIQIYDNESSDGTQAWLDSQEDIINQSSNVDLGVSAGWNFVLEILFKKQWKRAGHKMQGWGAEHVLVLNNDTILPSWFYRQLLSYKLPFISGISVNDMRQIAEPPPYRTKSPHPDFSAICLTREAWEKIGPFDESMVHYCGDMDYHLRAHRAGIHLYAANCPFYHERSSTLRLAAKEERDAIQAQADADRKVFKEKWGVGANDPAYENLFTEATFGIDRE
jgi:GT2 family glycosyltransferase